MKKVIPDYPRIRKTKRIKCLVIGISTLLIVIMACLEDAGWATIRTVNVFSGLAVIVITMLILSISEDGRKH